MKRPCIGIISRRHSAASMIDNLLWPTATRHISPDEADLRATDCDALLVDVAVLDEECPRLRTALSHHRVVALFAPTLAATGKPWIFPCEGEESRLHNTDTSTFGMQTVFIQLRDAPDDGEPTGEAANHTVSAWKTEGGWPR